jgi:L-aspartate oxidase
LPAQSEGRAGACATGADRREGTLRALMSRHVGVVRNAEGLAAAINAIARIEREADTQGLRNMAVAALLVATAAWRRHESRGAHFREDFPQSDPTQAHRVSGTLADARAIAQRAIHTADPILVPSE